MKKRNKAKFDPTAFLANVGEGKTVSKYRKDKIVYSQGDVADAVFYIQQGKVKITVVSEHGKEAVIAERPSAPHRNNEGGRGKRDYSPGEGDHDRYHSQRAGIF